MPWRGRGPANLEWTGLRIQVNVLTLGNEGIRQENLTATNGKHNRPLLAGVHN